MNILTILFITNFLRTLFIILIIYYVFRFLGRYVFPYMLRRAVSNMVNKQQQYAGQQTRQPEGKVTVEKNQRRQTHYAKDEGEYVDFEEVD